MTVDELQEPARPAAPRRLRPVHLALSAVSVLVGASVAVAVLFLAGWRDVPVNRYEIRVFFTDTTTADQKEAARLLLDRIPSEAGARLRSKAEAFQDAKKLYTDNGDPLPESLTPEAVPESLSLTTTGRDFDCASVAPVRAASGVESVRIAEVDGTDLVAAIDC